MQLISSAARAADLRLAAELVERHPEKIAELRAAEVAQRDAARAKAAAELAGAQTEGVAEIAAASRARDAAQVEALRAAGVWQARCNELKLVEAALAGAEARRDIAIDTQCLVTGPLSSSANPARSSSSASDRPTRRLRELASGMSSRFAASSSSLRNPVELRSSPSIWRKAAVWTDMGRGQSR